MMPLGTDGPSNPILPSLREVSRSLEATRDAQGARGLARMASRSALKPPSGLPVFDMGGTAQAVSAFAFPEKSPWPRMIARDAQTQPIVLAAREAPSPRRAPHGAFPWAAPAVPALLASRAPVAVAASIVQLEVPVPRPRMLSGKGGSLRLPLLAQTHRVSTRVAFATSKPGVPELRGVARSTDPIGNAMEALGARVMAGPAYIMPFENGRVTSLFNQGRHHPAIDLAGRMGAPVYATSHGQTVIFAGGRGGYGNAVITRDREGREHLYGHLSGINTRVGVTLAQGDRLGALGSTGYSTGPHVHYEVKDRRGSHINPVSLLFPRGVSAGYAWSGTGLVRGPATLQAALPAPVATAAAVPAKVAEVRSPPPALVRAQVGGLLAKGNQGRVRRPRATLEED
jgi:murein DD-endopeptidase MepM/ murein hydrolase activator NlpD